MNITTHKRYFNSDISVTINLADKINNPVARCYITLNYTFDAKQKAYKLQEQVEYAYCDQNVQTYSIDPRLFRQNFQQRDQDAIQIASMLLPQLDFKSHYKMAYH